ncbi:unnamed protein product [Rhizophagus irregularis]|nr:unnamed protein product [Rhizophagus irregularis]
MEPALNLLAADDPNVRRRYLGEVDRVNVDDTMVLLSPIERATHPRVKFTAFEDEIEKANAKNLVLNLTEYSSTLSPLLTTIGEAGDDIVKTRNFFRNLCNNTVALENTNTLVSRTLDNEMERLDAETARVTLCLKSWIHEAIC